MSSRTTSLHRGPVSRRHHATSRRPATVTLDVQAAYKFALAILVGLGAILGNLAASAGALILIVAILVAGRALTVLGAGPEDRVTFRPTAEASWDAALATAWGVLALVLAADGAVAGAVVAGAGAVALALLALRTRYVL